MDNQYPSSVTTAKNAAAVANKMDVRVGGLVRRLRGRWNTSQQQLANEMREHGFDWAQATVWGVETGKRALRLSEAVALSLILDIDLSDLTADEDAERMRAKRRLERAELELRDARTSWEALQ